MIVGWKGVVDVGQRAIAVPGAELTGVPRTLMASLGLESRPKVTSHRLCCFSSH